MTTTTRPARTAPEAPNARRTWHLRANAVVLLYVVAACVAVVVHAALPMPRWLAVHLLLLGGATNAIVTWTEHFAVALLRARPASRRLSAARLVALNVAVVAVLCGVSADVPAVTIAAAVLLSAVVVAHAASLAVVWKRALMSRFARTVGYYLTAAGALVVGITLGVLTVMAHRGSWGLGGVHDELHAAHVHANLFGWVALTVLGTLFTLWPTVLRTRMVDGVMADATRSLWLTGSGLVVAVAGLVAGQRLVAAVGMLPYVGGVLLALRPFAATWRQKAPRDPAAWSLAASVAWLAVGATADVVLLAVPGDLDAYLGRLDAVVPGLAVGFVLQVLVGALTYLVPVMRGGGPLQVRETIAALSPGWVARVVALNVGAVVLVIAALAEPPAAVTTGGWVLVLAPVAAFVLLVARAVLPTPARGPVGGVALGIVMTLVPVLIAVSGGAPASGPSSVRVAGSSGVQQVAVTMVGMDIRPAVIEVPAGTRVKLVVRNRDAMRHDLAFANGPSTPMLSQGQSATLDLGVVQANLSGWCTVPGHRAAGMTLDVRVTGSTAPAKAMSHATSSAPSAIDVHGQPGPGWTPYDATLAPASTATVHRMTLHVIEKDVEVAPGVRQRVWTFGGSVPGPTLRGHVGDLFEITLVNDGSMDHGIDFHAGETAPDAVMRSIAPGQSLVYRFRADHSGAWLYHCSTMPMTQHIANGMYGAVVIDPPNLPTVDREFVLVSSQLYVGSDGADPARLAAGQWDATEFNGYPDQYVHAPLKAKVGER
ncbi:MAG TPA: multicopper oxidase domain-containing protein, partial [Angustibacter sp.]|nr:multicopper oxidase domain-containing protein [Angustibacter sp.]